MRKPTCPMLLAALIMLMAMVVATPVRGDGGERFEIDRPLRITLKVEGRKTPLRGEITSWGYGNFWVQREGKQTSMRVAWSKLQPRKVYETARRLIDRDDADGYLRLGVEMLRADEKRLADQAFKKAIALDSALRAISERAITLHDSGADPGEAFDTTVPEPSPSAPAERSNPGVPEPRGPQPKQQASNKDLVASELAHARFDRLGIDADIYESEHFIAAVDSKGLSAKQLTVYLEKIYDAAATVLLESEEDALFEGRWVCFLIDDRDRFTEMQAQIQGGSRTSTPFSYIVNHRGFKEFGVRTIATRYITWEQSLLQAVTQSVIAGYHSGAPLPEWLKIGLQVSIQMRVAPGPGEAEATMKAATEYCKYNSMAVFARWNVERFDISHVETQYACSLLVESALASNPEAFRSWLKAIGQGRDWEYSMEEFFGVDLDEICKRFEAQLGEE